jgi:aspartate-semialdehyde dehydrogenase
MAIPLESRRIVIAGASSLLGAELKSLLEESRFAASDFRLVDEETAAGTLTEAGGEAAVIQTVEEDSFDKAWIVFCTGSSAFTRSNLSLAKRSGAYIVDLSGELAGQSEVHTWLPKIPTMADGGHANLFAIPSAPAEIIARLAIALSSLQPSTVSAVAFQPVSAAGKRGIEELESQTGQLLSFQSIGKQTFDAQVAYSMLDRFGASSGQSLGAALAAIRREVQAVLPPAAKQPAIQLLHAPVFYGSTVAACAFIEAPADALSVGKLCAGAGFVLTDDTTPPSNVSSAGEIAMQLAPPLPDQLAPGACWFWAAADNLRLPASNAVKLAEKLLQLKPSE